MSNETFSMIFKHCENGQKCFFIQFSKLFRLSFVTIIWEKGGLMACQNSVPF